LAQGNNFSFVDRFLAPGFTHAGVPPAVATGPYPSGANKTLVNGGGNRAPLAGQVIVYTATVSGGASVGIDFNPNYAPAPPAARLIN